MIKEVRASRKLKLELDGGMSGDREIVRSRTFSNINLDASLEDLYGAGKTLADLQVFELINVKKMDEVSLIKE